MTLKDIVIPREPVFGDRGIPEAIPEVVPDGEALLFIFPMKIPSF
jgi:hypothetical protein